MTDVAAPPAGAGPGTMSFPWWVALLRGIALLVVGGYLLAYPARTTVFLIAVLGWYWLFSGIFTIGSLFVERSQWGWRLAGGLLSIVAGGYIIAAPYVGAVLVVGTVTLLLGINGMIIGVIDIVKAFKGAGWGIGFLGLFSLIIGAMIAFNFTTYMTALPWVFGFFAIIAGIVGIVGSFQIKKAQAA